MKKLLLIIIPLVILFGCENDQENANNSSDSTVLHTVFAGNFYYDPPNITINQGDEIRWINDGGLHDVNGELNSLNNSPFNNPETFNSPATSIVGAEIYRHTFNVPGFYNYDCSIGGHAISGMTGTITVVELE